MTSAVKERRLNDGGGVRQAEEGLRTRRVLDLAGEDDIVVAMEIAPVELSSGGREEARLLS